MLIRALAVLHGNSFPCRVLLGGFKRVRSAAGSMALEFSAQSCLAFFRMARFVEFLELCVGILRSAFYPFIASYSSVRWVSVEVIFEREIIFFVMG